MKNRKKIYAETAASLCVIAVLVALTSGCGGSAALPVVGSSFGSSPSSIASQEPTQPVAFFQATKEYLLHGQDALVEAERLKWDPSFLEQVDIGKIYEGYLSSGGKAGDVKAFATYLTENAPVPENWKDLFEAALESLYGKRVSRYESLGDDLYQVYVEQEGTIVPYVVVNARTGSFHG